MVSPERVRKLRELTGCGLIDCKKTLELFNNNIFQSEEYLKMHGIAVCRRKKDGSLWKPEDYVNDVKNRIPEDLDLIKYWDIHITYGNRDGDGYSIFFKSRKSFNSDEAIEEAKNDGKFKELGDLNYIDYVEEITEEEYLEATNN